MENAQKSQYGEKLFHLIKVQLLPETRYKILDYLTEQVRQDEEEDNDHFEVGLVSVNYTWVSTIVDVTGQSFIHFKRITDVDFR